MNNCSAKFFIAEDEEQLDKILEVRNNIPSLEKIIIIDMQGLRDFSDPMAISFDELLELGKKINCPIVAIHGDYDPHLAEGVKEPLTRVLKDFRFVLLEKCGHEPWLERYARHEFYRILKREV